MERKRSKPVVLGADFGFPNPELADAEGLVAVGLIDKVEG